MISRPLDEIGNSDWALTPEHREVPDEHEFSEIPDHELLNDMRSHLTPELVREIQQAISAVEARTGEVDPERAKVSDDIKIERIARALVEMQELKPEIWERLNDSQRERTLQAVAEVIAGEYGVASPTVRFVPLPRGDQVVPFQRAT